MYDEMEKALKHPRIGSRPRVLNMFMTQDCCKTQPHSRASHSLPKLFWIAHSVRDDPYINNPSSLASIQSMNILYFPLSFHQTEA